MTTEKQIERILTQCDEECESGNRHDIIGLAKNIYGGIKEFVPEKDRHPVATVIADQIEATIYPPPSPPMTKDSQIKALAALGGWSRQMVEDGHSFSDPKKPLLVERWVSPNGHHSHRCPDYLEIYDSIIPLILQQREGIQRDIACAVWRKMKNNQEITNTELTLSLMAAMFKQTPEQLSEYLLRATGKWLD